MSERHVLVGSDALHHVMLSETPRDIRLPMSKTQLAIERGTNEHKHKEPMNGTYVRM